MKTYRRVETKNVVGRADQESEERGKPRTIFYLLWIGLAGSATILLVSMTNQITQEVAVVPFLWVLPLSIYLLTFILAFSGGILYSRNIYLVAFFVVAIFSRMLLNIPIANVGMQVFVFSLLLFISCMLCHNELYRLRPDARHLPSFLFDGRP